ncbi:MAG: ISAzo13-like element transposase-related protein, partial [Solirubrobacteraceae bacterium]
EKGIKVTDAELAAVHIVRDEFHGDWNYTIHPSPTAVIVS